MTSAEKAIELVRKFQENNIDIIYGDSSIKKMENYSGTMLTSSAKQCALIAVNEIIEYGSDLSWYHYNTEFWREVKREIEQL